MSLKKIREANNDIDKMTGKSPQTGTNRLILKENSMRLVKKIDSILKYMLMEKMKN